MPSIKEYDRKLHSLKNTRKMTKTMQMVSASKLRKAQEAQRNMMEYANELRELISRLAASVDAAAHPLLTPRTPVRRVLNLVFTSDKGLCGAFNNNMIKHVDRWLKESREAFEDVRLSFCARRGYAHFRKRVEVEEYYEGATAQPTFATAHYVAGELTRAFLEGECDEVYLTYNVFKSALSQSPTVRKLLPIEPEEVLGHGPAFAPEYLFEPEIEQLLTLLLPRTVSFKVYFAFLENAAGEHGARMTAMDSATTNADNLIEDYTLMRNRARQAAITTELTEIVSGAEAL